MFGRKIFFRGFFFWGGGNPLPHLLRLHGWAPDHPPAKSGPGDYARYCVSFELAHCFYTVLNLCFFQFNKHVCNCKNNTLKQTVKQRFPYNTRSIRLMCLIMTKGVNYIRLITFSTSIRYEVTGRVTHL